MRIDIVILRRIHASDEDINGINMGPSWFEEGRTYNVCESLAKNLMLLGAAEMLSPFASSAGPPGEHKMLAPVSVKRGKRKGAS